MTIYPVLCFTPQDYFITDNVLQTHFKKKEERKGDGTPAIEDLRVEGGGPVLLGEFPAGGAPHMHHDDRFTALERTLGEVR